jgi:hypothetical protein
MHRGTVLVGLFATVSGSPAVAQVRRLGFISTSTTSYDSPFLIALREGLRDRGWVEAAMFRSTTASASPVMSCWPWLRTLCGREWS